MSFALRDRLRCGRMLFILGLFSVWGSGALNGQPPAPPDKLQIDYRVGRGAPMAIRGYDNYHAYLVDSVSVKGKRWERQVRVSSPQHGSIAFPALRKDEIVAMFGALYRVESSAPLEIVRLKAEDAPKGIAVQKDSVVIPLMRDETGSGQVVYGTAKGELHWNNLFVTSIGSADDKGGEPVAKVKLDDIRKEAQTIRQGDVLKLGETEWTVRAIVPRGGERRVFGWVELGPRAKDADR